MLFFQIPNVLRRNQGFPIRMSVIKVRAVDWVQEHQLHIYLCVELDILASRLSVHLSQRVNVCKWFQGTAITPHLQSHKWLQETKRQNVLCVTLCGHVRSASLLMQCNSLSLQACQKDGSIFPPIMHLMRQIKDKGQLQQVLDREQQREEREETRRRKLPPHALLPEYEDDEVPVHNAEDMWVEHMDFKNYFLSSNNNKILKRNYGTENVTSSHWNVQHGH